MRFPWITSQGPKAYLPALVFSTYGFNWPRDLRSDFVRPHESWLDCVFSVWNLHRPASGSVPIAGPCANYKDFLRVIRAVALSRILPRTRVVPRVLAGQTRLRKSSPLSRHGT